MQLLFFYILAWVVSSSVIVNKNQRELLESLSITKESLVNSYYLMRKIFIDSTQEGNFEDLKVILSSKLKEYEIAITGFFFNSIKECLQMVQNTNDVEFYAFFGLLIHDFRTPNYEKSTFIIFDSTLKNSMEDEVLCDYYFGNYNWIVNSAILKVPLRVLDWQEQKETLMIVMEILKKFPVKKGIYPKIKLSSKKTFKFENYLEKLTFVVENFEVDMNTNQPDIRAFIKLYYDLEHLVARKYPVKKLEKMILLFKVYEFKLKQDREYLKQYFYSFPIKLLCLLYRLLPSGNSLVERLEMSLKDNITATNEDIRYFFGAICRKCAHLSFRVLGQVSDTIHSVNCDLNELELMAEVHQRIRTFSEATRYAVENCKANSSFNN
jgi:hypothetical protein